MTDPRPTKALVDELRAQLAARDQQLVTAAAGIRALEKALDAAPVADREARALAGCVAALDGMLADERSARSPGITYDYSATHSIRDYRARPPALDSPVGRILLHLASRYGVPIEATPPPPATATGPQVMVVPAPVAEQLSQFDPEVWEHFQR